MGGSSNKKRRRNNRSNKRNKIRKDNAEIGKEVKTVEEPTLNEKLDDRTASTKDGPVKRSHPGGEEDSDAQEFEITPRKKKKKKQPVPSEPSDNKKGKKSIRQIKKEKYAQRLAEAQAASKEHLKSECLNYLSQWKHDRDNWKFMKAKQVWLYKNKFSSYLMPDASWPLLLEYFETAKGNIRNMLLSDANKIIKKMDDWMESHNNQEKDDDEDTTDQEKPDETSYKRARDLIQCLQE